MSKIESLKAEYSKVLQSYKDKLEKLENGTRRKQENSIFDYEGQPLLKYHDKNYLALDIAVEGLLMIQDAYGGVIDTLQINTPRTLKLFRPQSDNPNSSIENYHQLLNNLHTLAIKSAWALRKEPNTEIADESEEIVRLRLSLAEYKDRQRKCDEEVKNLTIEYRNYMIKTKEWVEKANIEKEESIKQKDKLIEMVNHLTEKCKETEEAPILSPEMLSPEETSNLVMSIFNRSNKESLAVQLLQRSSDFVTILQEFLDFAIDISEQRHRSMIHENLSYESGSNHNKRFSFALNTHSSEIYDSPSTNRSPQNRPRSAIDTNLPPYIPHQRSGSSTSKYRSPQQMPGFSLTPKFTNQRPFYSHQSDEFMTRTYEY